MKWNSERGVGLQKEYISVKKTYLFTELENRRISARDNYIWSTNRTNRAGSGTNLSLVSRGHYRWAGTPFTFLQNRLESSWRSEMISSPYVTVTFSGDTNCAWWRGSRRLDGPSQYCFSRCSGTYVIHVFFNRNVCLFVGQSIKTLHPKWTHSVR